MRQRDIKIRPALSYPWLKWRRYRLPPPALCLCTRACIRIVRAPGVAPSPPPTSTSKKREKSGSANCSAPTSLGRWHSCRLSWRSGWA